MSQSQTRGKGLPSDSARLRLQDKVILVTGSATGIGEAMARLFVEEGARVIIHGKVEEEDAARSVAESISLEYEQRQGQGKKKKKDNAQRAAYVVGNLEDPERPAAIVAAAHRAFGRMDALVNNAAAISRGNLESTTLSAWDTTLAVNLRAPFLLIQAALPIFRGQGSDGNGACGRVLNIGSINSYCGEANQLAYSISKGGLTTMTRNLADAYGRQGLRVNQLNVGWTLTANEYALKQAEGLPADWPSQLPGHFAPSGRLLSPREVAWAAVYFLSDEAALINGAVVDLEQYPVIGRNPQKETKN